MANSDSIRHHYASVKTNLSV